MPKIRDDAPYDPTDRDSLMEYAYKLRGKRLRDVCTCEFKEHSSKDKGSFGSILESGYFYIENNSDPVPDFEVLGIELKAVPMKNASGGGRSYLPKERVSLGMINYMTLLDEGFEGSFYRKNHELLLVFYLDRGEPAVEDKVILDVKLWTFPLEDLRVMRDDWGIIAAKVRSGMAHELSCGDTFYIEASPKGQGHGTGERKQPFSEKSAKPRAFALKPRYVKEIWKTTVDGESIIKDLGEWSESKTFEEMILDRFKPYVGRHVSELMQELGLESVSSKDRYATLARRMMGVTGKKVLELEKADVSMKTIRLNKNGVPPESMSFPFFRYDDIVNGTWDESAFHEDLEKRFLFIVYRAGEDGNLVFEGAYFWSMPNDDMAMAEKVWTETQKRLHVDAFSELPKIKDSPVSHVRPHGRDKNDTYTGPDGLEHEKKSFWLNSRYIKKVLDGLRDQRQSKSGGDHRR